MTSATLNDSAAQLLRDSPLPQHLRRIEVAEDENEIVLLGEVNSYYHKQLAQEAVLPALAGRRLRNLLTVHAP